MYQIAFEATTSADWTQSIELIDSDTNLPLADIDDAVFKMTIGRCPSLSTQSNNGTGRLSRPEPHVISWIFTANDLNAYCGGTYPVGLTITTAGGTTQILIGSVAIIDGVVHS